MLSLISVSDKLNRFIKQSYAEFGFRLGQLYHITTVRHWICSAINPLLDVFEIKNDRKNYFNKGSGSYQW